MGLISLSQGTPLASLFSRWKSSFLCSLVFGLPVFIVTVTYMILSHRSRIHDIMIINGVSLQNLILFVLCTIVQVSAFVLDPLSIIASLH